MYVSGKAARIKALSSRGLLLGTILLTVQVLSSQPNKTLGSHIGYHLDIEPIRLSVGQAIPVALIVNEALNHLIAITHPADASVLITIQMHSTDDTVFLRVAFEGDLQPELADPAHLSPGLALIRQFSDERRGQLELSNAGRLAIIVVFPKETVSEEHPDEHLFINTV